MHSHILNEESNWEKADAEQRGAEWLPFEMAHCTIQMHNLEREFWDGLPKGSCSSIIMIEAIT